MADAQQVTPRLAQLGGRRLGISVGAVQWGQKIRKTQSQLDAQAELLEKGFAICERHKVVPNLHNHTYEVENDLHDLRGTLARLPGTKLGPDLNWLVRGGVDPVAFLREFGPQIVFLHLRDQHKNGAGPRRWVFKHQQLVIPYGARGMGHDSCNGSEGGAIEGRRFVLADVTPESAPGQDSRTVA